MAVLMADRNLAVRKRGAGALDGHGEPVGGAWGTMLGPWPGRAREAADGGWTLAVDPAGWPLSAGDLVVDAGTGQSWIARGTALLTNNLDSTVNYVRVDAQERVGAATEVVTSPQPTTHA